MKRLLPLLFLLLCLSLIASPTQGQDTVSDLFSRINNLRSQLGLAPYSLNPALTAAAQNHANWMAANSTASHIQDNGSRPRDRAAAAGYNSNWVSENIYIGGLAGVDDAWNFWTNSSVHYAGLTSANYQDIGIATATGAGGQAFVLVFGTMSWGGVTSQNTGTSSGGTSNSGGDSAAAAPPVFIVGWDSVGNIMHEVQPGDTLGDIALLYGYTWDDIPTMLELNEMTEGDMRNLEVGSVFLVPPLSGTYTPTPANAEAVAESTAEATSESTIEAEQEPQQGEQSSEELAGILPTPTESNSAAEATEEVVSEELLPPPATFDASAPSATPTSSSTPTITPTSETVIATVPAATSVAMNVESTPQPLAEPAVTQANNMPPLWLVAVIAIQIGILGFASYEFFRRR